MSSDPHHLLSYDDLEECKKQLFVEKTFNYDAQTEKGSILHKSSVNKGGTIVDAKQAPFKRIKLKQHVKTEIPTTPDKIDKTRMKTSPNRRSPVSHQNPLREKNMNIPTNHLHKHKNNLTEFFPINEIEPKNANQFRTLYTQLYPSPKKHSKHSLPYSSIHKDSIHMRRASKSEERSLSKSKKKMHFTVFDSKEKSIKKKSLLKIQQQQQLKGPKINYSMPYRYNSTITIDLFQDTKNKTSKSKNKRQASNISAKSLSKDCRKSSLQKKQGVARNLTKSLNDQQNEEKINRTLEKLKRYKFVDEYIEKWQILEKIQGYTRSNQPECKWSLLIVDEIFKRIREDNKFQSLVSK